jgi:hypothetical protein
VLRPARVKTRDSLSPEPTSEPKPEAVSDDELEHQRPSPNLVASGVRLRSLSLPFCRQLAWRGLLERPNTPRQAQG